MGFKMLPKAKILLSPGSRIWWLMTFWLIVFVDCNTTANHSFAGIEKISKTYASAIIQQHSDSNGNENNMNLDQLHLSPSQFELYIHRLRNVTKSDQFINCSAGAEKLCLENQIKCFSSGDLLRLKRLNNSRDADEGVSASDLQVLCPIILQNLDNAECARLSTSDDSHPEASREHLKPSSLEVWGYGFLFVTIINISSVFGAVLLPLMGKAFYHRLLMVLVGLAVGSLLGSAAFHLIPQAFGLLNKPGNHQYLITSLLILCGIYLFFMVERFLRIYIQHCEVIYFNNFVIQ